MSDAESGKQPGFKELAPDELRRRARHHREIAGQLLDGRLDRLLIEEAEALEARAAAAEHHDEYAGPNAVAEPALHASGDSGHR